MTIYKLSPFSFPEPRISPPDDYDPDRPCPCCEAIMQRHDEGHQYYCCECDEFHEPDDDLFDGTDYEYAMEKEDARMACYGY